VPIIGEMRKALLALVLVPAGAALGFVAEGLRLYPNRELAAHAIGFEGIDGKGLAGVTVFLSGGINPRYQESGSPRAVTDKEGRYELLGLANGQRVQTIPAGTYTIVVHDYSRFHNFALGSITQNRRIFTGGISFVGTKRYTVKLSPGKWTSGMYAYACSAHPRRMHGTFVVTPSQTSSTTTSP